MTAPRRFLDSSYVSSTPVQPIILSPSTNFDLGICLMTQYTQRVLTEGENLIYSARLSLWAQWSSLAIGGFLLILVVFSRWLLPLSLIGAFLLLKVWLAYQTTELSITNKRIISKAGILSHTVMELRLDKIESIRVSQSIFGRIFGYGSVTLAGTGGDKTLIEHICAPAEFQKHFMIANEKRNT